MTDMEDFFHQMAEKWWGHDETVKSRIAAMVDAGPDAERSADFYLGSFTGMLMVTERLSGVFDGMDENVRATYFAMLSYCAFRHKALTRR